MSIKAYQYPMWVSRLAKLLPAPLRQHIRSRQVLNQHLLAITNRRPIRRIAIGKVLLGGENGIRAADLARIFKEPLRPSTLAIHGHHLDFLRRYAECGDALLEEQALKETPFYKNIANCMAFTGHYRNFTKQQDIRTIAQHFIDAYKQDCAGGGEAIDAEPIMVMPVQHSSYYQIFNGHHRVARAIMQGAAEIRAVILPDVAVTPLQDALASVLWIGGRREIYQPIHAPEITEGWTLVRRCHDRLESMLAHLSKHGITAPARYLDLGSSHGWFVKEMLERGFDAHGVERDYFGRNIGTIAYGLDECRVTLSDLDRYLDGHPEPSDIVSFFSVIHHYLLAGDETSAGALLRKIDAITGRVLFFETAHGHENIDPKLAKWNDATIAEFIRAHTSFTEITLLGHDHDNVGVFAKAYRRALFACTR